MNVLCINAGSGSLRVSLFLDVGKGEPADSRDPDWEAIFDPSSPENRSNPTVKISREGGDQINGPSLSADSKMEERLEVIVPLLWADDGPLRSASDLDAVAHRIVHGGGQFSGPVVITAEVEEEIDHLSEFAPLHNPTGLSGIRSLRKILKKAEAFPPEVAVFDTSFHRTLPPAASTYAGPRWWLDRGIRRYGFHGINYRWASRYVAKRIGRSDDPQLKMLLCHLGGGCSLCATIGGMSIDTTMGFTPLDGIAMSTRSGSVDPGILIHLIRQGYDAGALEHMLNRESGLKGLSGGDPDTRTLVPQATAGIPAASLALEVFLHRLRAGAGAMLAALGGNPDAVVFTDGIGEDEPLVREELCKSFAFLGWRLDAQLNGRNPVDSMISAPSSTVPVWIVRSREAWQMADETGNLLRGE